VWRRAKLRRCHLPPHLAKQLPRSPAIPAAARGRLAVDHRRGGRGLGELLLFDTLSRTLRREIASYAFVADAIDETARTCCERYRFMPLPGAAQRLFLPLAEIASIFT
jgi:hypothetical protein